MSLKRLCTFLVMLTVLLSLAGLSLHADASELPEQSQVSISVSDEPSDPASFPLPSPALPGFDIGSTSIFISHESHYCDPQSALPERPPRA